MGVQGVTQRARSVWQHFHDDGVVELLLRARHAGGGDKVSDQARAVATDSSEPDNVRSSQVRERSVFAKYACPSGLTASRLTRRILEE
jgi:hypothetical protein